MTDRKPVTPDAEKAEMVRESATRIMKRFPSSWELEEVYNDLLFLASTFAEEDGARADDEEEEAPVTSGSVSNDRPRKRAFALSSACAALAPVVAITEPFLGERDRAHHVYDGSRVTAEGADVSVQVAKAMYGALDRLEELHDVKDVFRGETDLEALYIRAKDTLRLGAWAFQRVKEGEDWNIPGTVAGDLRTVLMEFREQAEEVAHV